MDGKQMEWISTACIIVGDEFTRLSYAVKAFNDALVADAAGVEPEAEKWVEDKCNPVAALRRLHEEMYAKHAMGEFAEMAEDPVAILPLPKKLPRPPKCTGPVNKANYTANRPQRMARSNCKNMKR